MEGAVSWPFFAGNSGPVGLGFRLVDGFARGRVYLGHALHGDEVGWCCRAEPGEDAEGGGVDGCHEGDLVVLFDDGRLVDADAVGPDETETTTAFGAVRIAEDVVEGRPEVLADLDLVAV